MLTILSFKLEQSASLMFSYPTIERPCCCRCMAQVVLSEITMLTEKVSKLMATTDQG